MLRKTLIRKIPLWFSRLWSPCFPGLGIMATFTVFNISGMVCVSFVLLNMWSKDSFKLSPAASHLKSSFMKPSGSLLFPFLRLCTAFSSWAIVHGWLFFCFATSSLGLQRVSFSCCSSNISGCMFLCLSLSTISSKQSFLMPSGLVMRFPLLSFRAVGLLVLSLGIRRFLAFQIPSEIMDTVNQIFT